MPPVDCWRAQRAGTGAVRHPWHRAARRARSPDL